MPLVLSPAVVLETTRSHSPVEPWVNEPTWDLTSESAGAGSRVTGVLLLLSWKLPVAVKRASTVWLVAVRVVVV